MQMKKILMHSTPNGPIAWDASTPALQELAFLALFGYLDGRDCYLAMDAVESQLYTMARNGNARAAQALLLLRKNSTGENFSEVTVNPTEEQKPRRIVNVKNDSIDIDISSFTAESN